ncbi:hypothetical protein EIJ81_00215 (plasmid) [Aliivibrio salmonicida]|uniref:hypothetical protein n=1 Tax=Aliivibrio salmonicida TaxID=40269 RepID=UPI000F6C0091|nr:hypothetical protein [Aliivibrio salmonicida]AZL83327.1 hypothetical protein EIJ81_00215 [Aliivibrio salmonicida]
MNRNNIEKNQITDVQKLIDRHSGSFIPVNNGESFKLCYEAEIERKDTDFFDALSPYDFMTNGCSELTLKGLKLKLQNLDNTLDGNSFWKNFSDSALQKYLHIILGKKWRTYLRTGAETNEDKPHHDDILKCLYLLAHLHKSNPFFIRQLSMQYDLWSIDLKLYAPRNDIHNSLAYSAFLAELHTNMLFKQSLQIKRLIKNLDHVIDLLVKYSDMSEVKALLQKRSPDTDPPSLKILAYSWISSITHNIKLHDVLKDNIAGEYNDNSASDLDKKQEDKFGGQVIATSNDYENVAAQGIRMALGRPISDSEYNECESDLIDLRTELVNAFCADANRSLSFGSKSTKWGKSEISLQSAIKKMTRKNLKSFHQILKTTTLNIIDVPEVYSSYVLNRSQYVMLIHSGQEDMANNKIELMRRNPSTECVLNYLKHNNLESISTDVEKLNLSLLRDGRNGSDLFFCNEIMELMPRK